VDNAELFNIIVKQDMIEQKSLDAMLYGVAQSNWNTYKAMVNQRDFLTEMYESEKKRPMHPAAFLLLDRLDKFLKTLSELIVEIAETCMDPQTKLELEIESDTNRTKSVFLKQIQLFVLALEQALNTTEEENEWIEDTLETRDDLVAHLGFLYYLSRDIDPDNSKANEFREKYQSLIEAHRYKCLMQIKFDQSNEKQQEMLSIIETLQKELGNKNKIIEEKKKELIKLHEMKTEVEKKFKTISKQTSSDDKKILNEKIKALNIKVAELESEIGRLTASTVSKDVHNKLLSDYTEIKSRKEALKKENAELNDLIHELQSESLSEKLETYLKENGMTDELLQVIHPYFIQYSEGKKPMDYDEENRANNRIGYCRVKRFESLGSFDYPINCGHFFVDADGKENRIFNVPDTSYIGQGQFVLVDEDYNFIRNFGYHFASNDEDSDVTQFGVVTHNGEVEKVELQTGEIIEASNKKYKVLQIGRLVGLNLNNEVIKIYRSIHFNADLFMDSVMVHGQQAYLIEHVIDEGCLLRNITTEKEHFMKMNASNEQKPQTIVFLKGEKIVNQLGSSDFYTTADCYPKSEMGTVIMHDDKALLERSNGERMIIKAIQDDVILQEGDTVIIDEFGKLIDIVESMDITPLYEKGHSRTKYKQDKDERLPVDSDHSEEALETRSEHLLILGNKAFENAYKLNMLKNGFVAEVVDGFESWHKIAKAARESDIIVVLTDHLSHKNYYRLKSEFADKKIIYSDFEGTNRIIDKVIEEIDGGDVETVEILRN